MFFVCVDGLNVGKGSLDGYLLSILKGATQQVRLIKTLGTVFTLTTLYYQREEDIICYFAFFSFVLESKYLGDIVKVLFKRLGFTGDCTPTLLLGIAILISGIDEARSLPFIRVWTVDLTFSPL